MKDVTIYTDGACKGNPGPGGWAAILIYNGVERVISSGECYTTNNKMELTAVIEALSVLKEPCNVVLYSDSKYVTETINLRRLERWVEEKFFNKKNKELWEQVVQLLKIHRVQFIWVKGHKNNPLNERCDKIASQEASKFNTNNTGKDGYAEMQFPSELEAYEYASTNDIDIIGVKLTEYGAKLVFNPTRSGMKQNDIKQGKLVEYVIGTMISNGSTMYLAKTGTTFDKGSATRVSRSQAVDKAKAMTKRSRNGYLWKAIKL